MKRTVDPEQDRLYAEMYAASAILKAFPKGNMGLTPDSVKASPEYQAAKRNYEQAFAKVQAYNSATIARK